MKKLFLTLSLFLLAGLFVVTPSFAVYVNDPYPNFIANNVVWNFVTGQLDFDTNVDLTQDVSTYSDNQFDPAIFDITDGGSVTYWTNSDSYNRGDISCTSSHCTIYNMFTNPN